MNPKTKAIVALALLIPAPSVAVLAGMYGWLGKPLGSAVFVFCKVWILLLPVLWFVGVERQPVRFAKPPAGAMRFGLLSGIALALIIGAFYAAVGRQALSFGLLKNAVVRMGLDSPWLFAAGAAYWIVVNALLEEYVWRWFAVRQFEALAKKSIAAVWSAAAFTLHHLLAIRLFMEPWAALLATAGIFIGALAWSYCFVRYRCVWPGYLSHALADVAIFAIAWKILFG